MTGAEQPAAFPPLWSNLMSGFSRHGIARKIYIVLQSGAAVGLIGIGLARVRASPGISLVYFAVAALIIGITVGVTLHKRAVMTLVFVLSILAALGAPFAPAVGWGRRAIAFALSLMYVWYFGRLQRTGLDAELGDNDRAPPQSPGAA
jgi:hypothetical protein